MPTDFPNQKTKRRRYRTRMFDKRLSFPDHIRTSAAAASGVGSGREKRRFSDPRGHRRVPSPAAQASANPRRATCAEEAANPHRAPCGRAQGRQPPPAGRAAALRRSAKARGGPNQDRSPRTDREVVLWPQRCAGNRFSEREMARLGNEKRRQHPGIGDAGKAARPDRGARLDKGIGPRPGPAAMTGDLRP